jgi:predicted DNA binding CopG/RHH family protein
MEGGIDWGSEKNASLRKRYGFGFERVLVALAENGLLAVREHPDCERDAHQARLVVEIERYAWVVPFVEAETAIFLKTMFPSRRATKEFPEERVVKQKRSEPEPILSDDEREDHAACEAGEWGGVDASPEQKARWALLARRTLDGERRRISISIPERDLAKLKTRAAEEGMPYQTLINSILHKYVEK